MIKRSRQREAIRQCLTGRYDHPTAETVYMSIKDEFPNISLGTVYRNLSLLSDLGEIQKITVSGGPDRFDGNPAPHYHCNRQVWQNCRLQRSSLMEQLKTIPFCFPDYARTAKRKTPIN